jgi:hypothetical protein
MRTKYSSRAVLGICAIWNVCEDSMRGANRREMVRFEGRVGLSLHLRYHAKLVVDHQLDVLYLRQKALATTKTCCLIVSRLIEQSNEMNR